MPCPGAHPGTVIAPAVLGGQRRDDAVVVACPGGFRGGSRRREHAPATAPAGPAGGRPEITSRHRRAGGGLPAPAVRRRSASTQCPGYIRSSITRMLPCGQLSACGAAPRPARPTGRQPPRNPPTGRDCRAIRHRETQQNAAGRALSPPQPRSRSIEDRGAVSPARHRISLVAATKVNPPVRTWSRAQGGAGGAGRVTSVTICRVTWATIRKRLILAGQGFFPVAAAFSGRRR
jgi:hypothetical protein